MTDSIAAESILIGAFLDGMSTTYPTIIIALENQTTSDIDKESSWVRFEVRDNGSRQSTVGQTGHRKFIRYGIIVFQVHVKPDDATYNGKSICSSIVDMFEGKRISNGVDGSVIGQQGTYRGTGITDGWYQFTGSIEYEYEDNK